MLGAKKTTKLGAKKVGGSGGEDIDFEAAEKAAKAEAERIEKLGYDPEDDVAQSSSKNKATNINTNDTNIIAPTPLSPSQAASKAQHQRSPSEVERLGMGMGRLGFGQIGKPAGSTAPAPKKLGFGAVGLKKAAADGMSRSLHKSPF